MFVFSPKYLHYLELLRVRNERRLPVHLILVPCILVGDMEEIYQQLPGHLRDEDVVFVFSEFVRGRLGKISKRYDDFTTPCVIDYDTFPENTKGPSDTLDIFYCARLVPEKGLAELLRALGRLQQEHRQFRLHIVTDARPAHAPKAYVDEVNRLVREFWLQPHLRMYGSLLDEQQKRRDLMARCDVLVNLTLYEGETFGRIIVEGFAAGLAVITSNWQGVNESVTPENGYLIDVHEEGGAKRIDVDGVADALRALYRPETLMTFKRVNREKARQYDFRVHVERLRQLIETRLASAEREVSSNDPPGSG
jgi:glycosyltransferase involved in cell wall biosynthesis